jgi:hypothetical protein
MMNPKKAMRIAALCVGLFGVIFIAVGVITFAALAMPETRALRIAANEAYPVHDAVYTEYSRTGTTMNNEPMYRLHFRWGEYTGRTNAVFSHARAAARVGQSVRIRVSDAGVAVPLEFERGANSVIGFVFVGVFGGLGLVAVVVAAVLGAVGRKKGGMRTPDNTETNFYR